MSELEREAVRYARSGLKVLPVAGKLPVTKNGVHDATDQVSKVRFWFRNYRDPKLGVAIACGHPLRSGGYLAVLDVDVQHDGDHSLADIEGEHGDLPATWTVRSPSGGWHFYYCTAELVSSSTGFRPGLELRSGGLYVVAPPSPGYEIEATGRIADAPSWLLAAARTQNPKGPAPPLAEQIVPGNRNVALTSLAGTLRRRGLLETEILGCLAVVNASRCDPPLAEKDLDRIAKSIARFPPAIPLVKERVA